MKIFTQTHGKFCSIDFLIPKVQDYLSQYRIGLVKMYINAPDVARAP